MINEQRGKPRLAQIRDRYLSDATLQQHSLPSKKSTTNLSRANLSLPSLTVRSHSRSTRGAVFKIWKEVERQEKENLKLKEEIHNLQEDLGRKDDSYSRRLSQYQQQVDSLKERINRIEPSQTNHSINQYSDRMERHRDLVKQIKSHAGCLESAIKTTVKDEFNIISRTFTHKVHDAEAKLQSVRSQPPSDDVLQLQKAMDTARGEERFLSDQLRELVDNNEVIASQNIELVREIDSYKRKNSAIVDELGEEKKRYHQQCQLLRDFEESIEKKKRSISRQNSCHLNEKIPKLQLKQIKESTEGRSSWQSCSSRAQSNHQSNDDVKVKGGQSARLLKSLNTAQLDRLSKSARTNSNTKRFGVDNLESQAKRLSGLLINKKKTLKHLRKKHLKSINNMNEFEFLIRKSLSGVRNSDNFNSLSPQEKAKLIEMSLFSETLLDKLKAK
ncbi:hypothetical protein P9112_004224 [Eukaryota sp. TZLM1-RC]